MTLAHVTTSASIGGATSETLTASGKITLTATQTAKSTTTAKADAVSGTVVIGLALALAIVDHIVSATITRSANATGGDMALSATGSSANVTEAYGSATGAKGDDGGASDGSGKDVNGKANDQLGSANSSRTSGTGKTATKSNTNDAKAQSSDTNSGGGNTVTVAAAFGIAIVTTRSETSLADGATVGATGKVSLVSKANTDSSALGDGKAKEAGTVGIAAGVAVNKVEIRNVATTNDATVNANGLEVQARMNPTSGDEIQRFDDGSWTTVPHGPEFPESPSDDEFFRLTETVTGASTVNGDQTLGMTLTLKNASDFDASGGTFKVTGIADECTYTGKSGNQLTGISGCTGDAKDKVAVTVTTKTKVNGAGQSLPGTLTVTSTTGFGTSGKFTVAGVNGVCSYTGSTTTALTGITGCTGTPSHDAVVKKVAREPGIYKWEDSSSEWQLQSPGTINGGEALPASPSNGDFFRLAQHAITAEARAGAGGDSSKVSIAGALALNIVSNRTTATVGDAANVTAGTGAVSIVTRSNEEDIANADSNAKGGTVGIGASVALTILDDHITRSAVEDGATFAGGAAFDITADSRHVVTTTDKAGSAGGVSVSPSVSIAIVKDQTSARLGTGNALTVTGAAAVKATAELTSSVTSDAEAGGSNVAVGAAVAINVVTTITTADVQRSLTAASLEVRAATTAASGAEAFSSSKGESDSGKKGDDQSKDQVNNNPNTNGKTDGDLPKSQDSSNQASTESGGKSGEKSGGVNIAASVAVNWARHTNSASIGNGVVTPVITAAGAVTVSAVNVAGANARAIGVAGDLQASTAVGAAIGLNVEVVTNTASVGADTQISAAGITVEAITPEGKRNDFVVWGLAAAGGKSDASVAGSVGIQVLTFTTNASVGKGAQLTSTEGIDVKATAFLGLQNLALAGGLSTSGTAVGGAAAINIFPSVSTIAMIDSGTAAGDVTVVNAAKKISVTARATLDPIVPHTGLSDKLDSNLPAVSSVAVGGSAGGGSAAVTGSFVVNIVSLTTKAFIGDGAQVNQTTHAATQSIEVKAEDLTTITNVAGALALNNGSAAVAVTVIVEIINKDVQAFIGKSAQVSAGPLVGACACDVDVRAIASENLFELAVSGGAGTGAAVAGSILVVLLNEIGPQATRAYIDENATVSARGKVEVNASDTANLDLAAGNIAIGTGSAGVGASAAILVA